MTKSKKISLFQSVVTLKCPRCRQGDLFCKPGLIRYNNVLEMPEKCPDCGQVYEIEPGFWIGALWMSYPLVVAIELPFLFAALLTTNYSPWLFFGLMLLAFVVFFPLLLRLGRSIWIHISIRYDNQLSN